MCVERQREILESAWKVLKPGGVLIYSTCTFNSHENEEQVQWLIDEMEAEYLPLKIEDDWQCPFVLCLHSLGCLRRGVRASGSFQERTGKSGSFGMWDHPRG